MHRDQSCPANSRSYLIRQIEPQPMPSPASTSPLLDSSRPVIRNPTSFPYIYQYTPSTPPRSSLQLQQINHHFRNGSHLRAHGGARQVLNCLRPRPNTTPTLHSTSLFARELRAQPQPQPRNLRPDKLQKGQRPARSRRRHRQLREPPKPKCGAAGAESARYLCEELRISISVAGWDEGVFE